MPFDHPQALQGLALSPGRRRQVERAAARLRDGVLERDEAGGLPALEISVLREEGLLVVPWAEGADGGSWEDILAAVAELATVDPSAAALLGYHHMHVLLLAESGNPDIARWAVEGTARNGWFWGGANNPSGEKVSVRVLDNGYELTGSKEFATGSLGADKLIIQELHPTEAAPNRRLVLAVDADSPGLSVLDDWDGIGVVRSATNRIRFDKVFVPLNRFVKFARTGNEPPSAVEAASAPGFQILFANLYLGIALGALRRALDLLNGDGSGVPNRRKGLSQVQEVLGELVVRISAALAVVAEANRHFAATLGNAARGVDNYRSLSARVFPAKVFVHETVLEVTQRVFEVTGSRGAMRQTGLDKFWRDARNHSLHDELRLRHRLIGAGTLGVDPA